MLALQHLHPTPDRCIPNVLPCRLHHNGPAKVTKRYWNPSVGNDGIKTAYFRGRRLRSRTAKLSAGYQGVVVQPTERMVIPQSEKLGKSSQPIDLDAEQEEEEEERDAEPYKVMEVVSHFDEIEVWGHDQVPNTDDTFVKGVQEWLSFAELIHGNSKPTDGNDPTP